MKSNLTETLVAVTLLIVTVLLLNPFDFWMPNMLAMGMLAVLFVLFAVFAGFVMREEGGDERDVQHRALSGRNAFLAGSGVLIAGIVLQGLAHAIDPWLVGTLMTMIVVKIGTRLWSDRNL